MADLTLGMVQINVTDLDEAWRFYVETLGLEGRRKLGWNHPFELALGGGGPTVLVYPVRRPSAGEYTETAGVTLVFHTRDLEGTVAEWRARGVEFVPIAWAKTASGIAETPFGPFIAFRDPFGNVHELLEPSPGG